MFRIFNALVFSLGEVDMDTPCQRLQKHAKKEGNWNNILTDIVSMHIALESVSWNRRDFNR